METVSSQGMFFQVVILCQEMDKILSQKCGLSSILEAVKNFSYFPTLKTMIMVSAVLFSRKPFFLMIRLNKMRWRREFLWKTLL